MRIRLVSLALSSRLIQGNRIHGHGFRDVIKESLQESGREWARHHDEHSSGHMSASANRHGQELDSQLELEGLLETTEVDESVRETLLLATQSLLQTPDNSTACNRVVSAGDVDKLVDLRGCFPHLEEACPNIDALHKEFAMKPTALKQNNIGNSKSQILMAPNFEHEYVVKSVKEEEAQNIVKVMAALRREQKGSRGPYTSFLTPVCFVAWARIKVKGGWRSMWKSKEELQPWIVMRRIRLTAQMLDKFDLHGEDATGRFYDVKGPTWAKWDGKSVLDIQRLRGNGKGKFKDLGFAQAFGSGGRGGLTFIDAIGVDGCEKCGKLMSGLSRDANLLARVGITDYSLFVMTYGSTTRVTHACGPKGKFPHVFKARSQKTGSSYIIAAGIIDFGESRAASRLKVFSTMIAPDRYRKTFGEMWKVGGRNYFHCGKNAEIVTTRRRRRRRFR